MIGTSPVLPTTIDNNTLLPMQYDFRQLYASVMQDWLCLSAKETDNVLGSAYARLPIFKSANLSAVAGIELTGQYINGESRLNYKVAENNKYSSFAIEFSTDGITFTEVKRIVNTSLNALESYIYTEVKNTSKMYYRIAGRNNQGAIKYSNMIVLRNNQQQLISVNPNPVVNNQINIKLFETPNSAVDVNILTMTGQKLYSNRFAQPGSVLSFKVPTFTANAHYILEVVYGTTIAHEQIMFR